MTDPMSAAIAALTQGGMLPSSTPPPPPEPPATPEQLAAREAHRKEQLDEATSMLLDTRNDIEKLTKYKEDLEDLIRDLNGPNSQHEILPGVGVKVDAPPVVITEAAAKAKLTPEQLALCYDRPKFSVTIARKALGDSVVDALAVLKPGGKPTVRVL